MDITRMKLSDIDIKFKLFPYMININQNMATKVDLESSPKKRP